MNQSDTIAELLKVVDGGAPSTTPIDAPVLAEGDEILELENFDFEDFQVVRREFFAHLREPSVTFNDCKFQVNMACLTKFPNCDFAHGRRASIFSSWLTRTCAKSQFGNLVRQAILT